MLLLAVASVSTSSFASGRHSAKINSLNLDKFHIIDLSKTPGALRLNYIGSTEGGSHLFLESKVATSKWTDKDGNEKVGMPWHHISQHQISNKVISIKNGWILDFNNNTYNLKPKYCPTIQLIRNKISYTLPSNKNIKNSCLSGRYIYKRHNIQ